jgi:hypothetical protein
MRYDISTLIAELELKIANCCGDKRQFCESYGCSTMREIVAKLIVIDSCRAMPPTKHIGVLLSEINKESALTSQQERLIIEYVKAIDSHRASAPMEGVMSEEEFRAVLSELECTPLGSVAACDLRAKILIAFSTLYRRLAEAEQKLAEKQQLATAAVKGDEELENIIGEVLYNTSAAISRQAVPGRLPKHVMQFVVAQPHVRGKYQCLAKHAISELRRIGWGPQSVTERNQLNSDTVTIPNCKWCKKPMPDLEGMNVEAVCIDCMVDTFGNRDLPDSPTPASEEPKEVL